MGNLTKNISRHEIECNCGCGFDTVDYELIDIMQKTCDYFADKLHLKRVVLIITGPNRCKKYNENVDGAINSEHIDGRALDFRIKEIEADILADYLDKKYKDRISLGRYFNRVHLGTRDRGARWEVKPI